MDEVTEDQVIALAMQAAKDWRLANGLNDSGSGGMSTTGSYHAAIRAAFDVGRRVGRSEATRG